MSVPPVISLVTLAVADVAASTAFYEALGFELSPASVAGDVSFFRTAGGLLALWGVDEMRRDSGADSGAVGGDRNGDRGVTLAVNVGSREEVDVALPSAEPPGAPIPRGAEATDWGGYN